MCESREDDAGYIHFYDTSTGRPVRDDPNLSKMVSDIRVSYKKIKYVIYRSAQKLNALQNGLMTIHIPYSMVKSILEHHKLMPGDSVPSIKPAQLTSIIFDIFYASEKLSLFSGRIGFDLQTACSVLSNLFWNIFDPNRNSSISASELKQTFLILCYSSTFEEIIYENFQLLADHNRCISRLRFESMVKTMTKIFIYLDEIDNYNNQTISNLVQSSFEQSPGIVGLNEYQFNCLWNNSQNDFGQYSNVINLSRRINASQNVFHVNVKCIKCQILPIQGLRFKCQRCKNHSLCLNCFSMGFTSKNHDISHRMYEISTIEAKPNRFIVLLSKMCDLFKFSSSAGPSQSPVDTTNMKTKLIEDTDTEMKPINSSVNVTTLNRSKSIFDTSGTGNRSTSVIMDKLTCVIDVLNEQYLLLQNNLHNKNINDPDKFLETHSTILYAQIEKLRDLQNQSYAFFLPNSSTPLRQQTIAVKRGDVSSSPLSRSIHGAEINKTFLDRNNSNLSVRDISTWFANRKSMSGLNSKIIEENPAEDFNVETQMNNFKTLLCKVKEIVDDSYSDNVELSNATQQLEKVLDDIIGDEEKKRVD